MQKQVKFWVFQENRLLFRCLAELKNTSLSLPEREGRTGEYCPEVLAVRTKYSEVRTNTTEVHHSPIRVKQARLVNLLCPRHSRAFENKKTKQKKPPLV